MIFLILCGVMSLVQGPLAAQELQALARIKPEASRISSGGPDEARIFLGLTQAVPYRVFTLANPPRLVADFREVNFAGLDPEALIRTRLVTEARFGIFRPGWSRLVLLLQEPMRIKTVEMKTNEISGAADLNVVLRLTDPETFAAKSGASEGALWQADLPMLPVVAKTRPDGHRSVVVALDPGHGGIDPGAQYQSYDEADLMLKLARELKERLVLSGNYTVFLTRSEDVFVSLPERVRRAREGGADIFISLHADALASGDATGTTIYTLSDLASDKASDELAAAHDHLDLLAGVDLSEQGDLIAAVLMDMARVETQPRSEKLADELVEGIADGIGRIRSRPRLSAGFSVLKAPDIPSVLIEFGFMSNPTDLKNLTNKDWRIKAIKGIVNALDRWSISDAAEGKLLRQ